MRPEDVARVAGEALSRHYVTLDNLAELKSGVVAEIARGHNSLLQWLVILLLVQSGVTVALVKLFCR